MSGPVPNLTPRRWQADFRSNRAFAAGEEAPAPRSLLVCVRNALATAYSRDRTVSTFAVDVPRANDRGAIVEAASRQLLTNPTLDGQDGKLPQGYRENGAVVSDVVRSVYKGRRAIAFTLTTENATGAPASYRLDLEAAGGIAIPDSRQAVFGGLAQVITATNTTLHEARLIPRLAGGSATADQGRIALAIGEPAPFQSVPVIDPAAVLLAPALTWVIAAGSVGVTRIFLVGPQAEEGTALTSFIPVTPTIEIRDEVYPNPELIGAVAGTPGTLPPEFALGPISAGATTATPVVLAVSGDTIDLELTTTAGVSAAIQDFYLSRPAGSPSGLIGAIEGQHRQCGFQYQVLAVHADANLRYNLTSRTNANVVVDSTTETLTSTELATANRIIPSVGPSGNALVMAIRYTVPAGTTGTVRIRIKRPSALRISTVPGSGNALRPADNLRLSAPGLFSGITEQLIDAELDGLKAGSVLQSITFASGYKLNLVAGPDTGVIVYPPSGESVSVMSPLHAAPGVMRLAVAYRPGQIAIGWPDCCDRDYATLDVPGFDPTTATAVWLGSDNGSNVLSTAVRTIELRTASTSARDLKIRTRDSWAPAHFVQPRTGFVGGDIALAAAYSPRQVVVNGPAHVYTDVGNAYTARTNGGAAKVDRLPAANSVGSVEGRPKRFQMRNIDTAGAQTITSEGGLLYPFQSAIPYTLEPVESVVLQPGQWAFFIADGYNKTTGLWQANNENWWFVIRDSIDLDDTYEFLSVYGPSNPADPNRAIIFPPHFCAYNADIGPVRQQGGAMVAAMNRWVRYRSQADAAHGMRVLADACRRNYWYRSIGNTTITALKSQICSTGFAYLGLRDSGVGSAEDHRVIRAWFTDRMEQSIAFFNAQTAAGALTARGNHGQQAALAAAVCACILDRADFLRYAIAGFELAVNDSADTPGSVGACLLEMKRADKSLSYSCLAMTSITALAEILERCGYPAYAFRGGHLIKMINFVAAAVDDPSIITAEQARLITVGGAWGANVVAVTQQPLPLGNDLDPNTGEQLVAESGVAFLAMAFKRLTLLQAPWKAIWAARLGAFGTVFNGTIGGAQSYLYFLFGVVVPEFPADA